MASGSNSFIGKIARQDDGKIVAVGATFNGSNYDWRIARYNTDGGLDASFGTAGTVVKDFGDTDALGDVAIQPDGKIVVGGYTRVVPGDAQWTVARFGSDGTPDLGFGTLGLATSFTSNSSNLLGVTLQPDGKIVAVGYTRGPNLLHDDIATARYNDDGSPDLSYGFGTGVATVGLDFGGTPNDRGNAVAIQSDGKIVVFGDYDTGQHRDNIVLLRFNANGGLDTGFGVDGKRFDNFSFHNGGRDVKLQADGKIVVSGATCNGPCHTYVARYNTDGSRDSSFGSNGVLVTPLSSQSDSFNALTIAPSGQILAAGSKSNGTGDSMVSRLNSDGTLDQGFGTNGTFAFSATSSDDGLNDILLQPDGEILVGGTASNGAYNDWFLARLSDNQPGAGNQAPSVSIAGGGLTDTYSAANGTELEAHNPDYQTENPSFISENQIAPYQTTTRLNNHDFVDGCLSMDWTGNSSNTNMSIRSTATGYYGFIQNNGSWLLYRNDANHIIASGSLDFSGTHNYKLCAIGSTISVSRDGSLLGSGTDTGIPGAGGETFYSEGNTLDNLSVSPVITSTVGDTYSANGSFVDADSTSWTGTVDYGDGSGAQPLALSGTSFALSHAYQQPGTYTLTVAVTDDQGAATSATEQIVVVTPQHTVSGTVFLDTNNSGVQDSGEPGYAGVTMHLWAGLTNWQMLHSVSAITDANGHYSIPIPIDTTDEWLKIEVPTGFEGSTVGIVGFGNQDATQNFGIRQPSALPTVFSDNFTAPDGTTLVAHNSAWTVNQTMPIIQNNQLQEPNSGPSDPTGPFAYVMTDQCMSFDMQLPTSFIAMHIRQHPLGQTGGYGSDFAAQPGSYGVSLYKAGGGYFPGGMQFPKALLSDGMHRFRLCAIGTNVRSYIDDSLMYMATDSEWTQGIAHLGIGAGTVIDNFKVEGLMVGPPVYAVATNTRNSFGNNNIVATVGSTGIAAGDTATVSVATGTFAGATGCTDSKGNTYTVVADRNSGQGRLFVCSSRLTTALTAGDTITATYPAFSGISVVSVNAIAGWASNGNVLAGNSANGNSASPNSGNITTGGPTVLFGVVAHGSTPTFTPGANYTLVGQVSGGSGAAKRTVSPEFRIVSSGGTYSAGGTISNGGQFWQAAVVGYAGQ
jgi:uncharacterized delta-60 repeat protein